MVEQAPPPVLDRAIARSRSLSDQPPLHTPSGRRARLDAELERVNIFGADSVWTLLYLMAYDHETPRLSLPAWASIGRR